MSEASAEPTAEEKLSRLRSDPAAAAILSDIDGTLAPIVERPEQAAVPETARAVLAELSGRFGLVGCISGRPAARARELVGLDGIAYAGNHGLELLLPHQPTPQPHPALSGHERDAADFLASLGREGLIADGLREEDKGAIRALHWRGAADEAAAEASAREIAARAERAGLATHFGRKVLELRPPGAVGKDAAISALLSGAAVSGALYGGDDRTDLDAFARLRELVGEGGLDLALCVAVDSPEAPAELRERSDMLVAGPRGWLGLLRELAA